MRILVCSDTHLGHRRKDCDLLWHQAYLQFERILAKAIHRDVDAIIHAGDFFDGPCLSHDMQRTADLMQHYLCGKQKAGVCWRKRRLVSPMMIPFVAIAGNHDGKSLSSLEILKSFGYVESPETECYEERGRTMYTMYPFVIEKGEESVAIYGIDYMDQEEACRMWEEDRVRVCEPIVNCSVKICLIHQDMTARFGKPAFPREKMPFDYVIYGHEHDCVIYNDGRSIQPGSSHPMRISKEDIGCKSVIIMETDPVRFEMVQLDTPWVINEKVSLPNNVGENAKEVIERVVKNAFDKPGYGMGRVTFRYCGERKDLPEINGMINILKGEIKNAMNDDIVRYEIVPKQVVNVPVNNSRSRELLDILREEIERISPKVVVKDVINDLLSGTVQRMESKKRKQHMNDVINARIESNIEEGRKRKLDN